MAAKVDLSSISLPLHKRKVSVCGKNGVKSDVPAFSQTWATKREYVTYFPPPRESDALWEDWKEMMIVLETDLEWLLQLPHHLFWSRMAFDESLHKCLEVYLQSAPRAWDLDGLPTGDAKSLWNNVHRSVFMVFLRAATYKESKSDHIEPEAFGNLIYEYYVFDIAKVLDLCAIYGWSNSSILEKMIRNIFTEQHCYYDDLRHAIHATIKAQQTTLMELGITEASNAPGMLSSRRNSGIVDLQKFQDVLLYAVDLAATTNSFINVYIDARKSFLDTGFVPKAAAFYEAFVPKALSYIDQFAKDEDRETKKTCNRLTFLLKYARHSILHSVRNVLETACIQPLLNASSFSDNKKPATEFLEVLGECLSESLFMCDYDSRFPFHEDLNMLSEANILLDPTQCDYIVNGIAVCYTHAVLPEDAATVLPGSVEPPAQAKLPDIRSENTKQVSENTKSVSTVELDSLISQVKDLLPDFGEGYIEECLIYHNYSSEAVINMLLENSQPEALMKVDKQLPRTKKKEETDPLYERSNVYNNDEFDVFSRNDVDVSRIHKGKRKDYANFQEMFDDKSDVNKKSYEMFGAVDVAEGSYYDKDVLNDDEYDDEYDDTYDEQAVGQEEPDSRVWVRPLNVKLADMSEESEEEDETQVKQEKPRDCFVQNPAELRAQAEQRRQQRMQQRHPGHRDVVGKPKGEGQTNNVDRNRHNKNVHKSSRANHNRKAQAQKKRGMVFPS